ncbi:MAG: RNHCP domain-containing protein [Candidatus Dojkabacteria bacterium]|nr:RNHCP domain-containing protein [Candidatus Dojkabacteria bacterium]
MAAQHSKTFICKHCGRDVPYAAPGTHHRNHCPFCLYSRHVDIVRGDRKSRCGGMMKPIGIVERPDGEFLIVHQCQGCGFISKNRIAGDDDDTVLSTLSRQSLDDRLL